MKKHFILLLVALSVALSSFSQSLNEGNDPVFTIADHPPEFVGGIDSLFAFLGKNLVYPKEAKKSGIQGRVYVGFVVGKEGVVREVKVIRGVHPLLDAEALRVVKLMPEWKPGVLDGEPVSVSFNLPINFNLTYDRGKKKK